MIYLYTLRNNSHIACGCATKNGSIVCGSSCNTFYYLDRQLKILEDLWSNYKSK